MKLSSYSTFPAYIRAQENLGKRRPDQALAPAITISRQCGAGAVTVASLVAGYFNERRKKEGATPWLVFDRDLAERVLLDHKLPRPLSRYMKEDITPELKAAFEEFVGLHPSHWTLVQHTNETILRLARAGHAIIVGRGANIVTVRLPTAFHVRLVAPLEFRVRQIMDLLNLSDKDATEHVLRTDRARKRYLRRNFLADIDDPCGYDLTINTGRIPFESAARLIIRGTLFKLRCEDKK